MKPALHGRDHRHGGADPIPFTVFLAPSGLMGAVLPTLMIRDIGFGLMGGVLYLPEREGDQAASGEDIRVSYQFAQPDPDNFDWLGARLHAVSGLRVDRYVHTQPWESEPWVGSFTSSTTGTSLSLSPLGGNFQNFFYGFAGVSDDDTDTVHFEAAGGAFDTDEQFGWDVPGVGHVGYMFHDFTTSDTGNVAVTFANGGEIRAGYVRCLRDGAVTVGSMLGEDDDVNVSAFDLALTGDVPAGSGLIVVTAAKGPAGYAPTPPTSRPVVEIESRRPTSTLTPVYRIGGQTFPVLRDIGGLGQTGGDLDGGSP